MIEPTAVETLREAQNLRGHSRQALLESELFGPREKAHYRASHNALARVRSSRGATIFLDEMEKIRRTCKNQACSACCKKESSSGLGSSRTLRTDARLIGRDEPGFWKHG